MTRNAVLDYARLLAAFGIVLFHSGAPGAAVGYAALPFFLMLLVMLMVSGARQMCFYEFARSRANRLLLPWLVWSAVYGGLKLLDAVASAGTIAAEFPPYVWLTGPALHLWFLPFAFFCCVALYPIVRLRLDVPEFAGLVTAIVILSLPLIGLHQNQLLPIPLAQWVFGGSAVLFGLVFALADGNRSRLVLALGALAGTLAAAIALGWTNGILQLGIAGVALTCCILWHRPETPFSRWAARVSLGVYLAHPLVAALLGRLTHLLHGHLSFAVFTITGSVAMAWLADLVSQRRILHRVQLKRR